MAYKESTIMSDLGKDNQTNGSGPEDPTLATFVLVVDICLASFSVSNLIVNFSLLLLSAGFIRSGCQSSSDVNVRRPHYGLHFFIFHCVLSSFLLECIGALTNVGYLCTGQNILLMHIESIEMQQAVKKALDFLTYALFNVSHLNFVLLLNVDKLLYVLRPLHYHEMMNRKRVCLVCVVTWLVASAMASPSLMYLDLNAQVRQEAILFAMCVVCPASFDLLSAIIVSTLVYRIQLRDHRVTRLSIKAPSNTSTRRRLFSRTSDKTEMEKTNGILDDELQRAQMINRNTHPPETFRHCRVFLRAFTPIIWTCFTTLPYTATMIYLYFGSDDENDFIKKWTDITMFKVLRALGCLYVTYFTGVPLIIIFNNQMYRKRIKTLARLVSKKLRDFNRLIYSKKYSTVSKSDLKNATNNMTTTIGLSTSIMGPYKDGHTCNTQTYSCTEV